jgi:hypothetical protein
MVARLKTESVCVLTAEGQDVFDGEVLLQVFSP